MWAAFMACTAVDSLTGKKSKKAVTSGSSSSSPSSTTKVTSKLSTSSGSGKTIRQLLAKALPASQ
jgi:hypothetical protein